MLIDKVLPAHVLAGYVWDLWKNNANVSPISGRNGLPLARIAPVTDEPDLRDSGQTYILYGFAENEANKLEPLHTGTFAMRIISKDFSELSYLMRMFGAAFELENESANSVNLWSYQRDAMRGMRFTNLCVTFTQAADASTTEGGYIEGQVNIKYQYIVTFNGFKVFTPSGWKAPAFSGDDVSIFGSDTATLKIQEFQAFNVAKSDTSGLKITESSSVEVL